MTDINDAHDSLAAAYRQVKAPPALATKIFAGTAHVRRPLPWPWLLAGASFASVLMILLLVQPSATRQPYSAPVMTLAAVGDALSSAPANTMPGLSGVRTPARPQMPAKPLISLQSPQLKEGTRP